MEQYFYTTFENQVREDGSKGLLYEWFFDDETQTVSTLDRAYSKYFTICAAAAISGIPYHAAMLVRSDGVVLEEKVWDRRG